MMGFLLASMFGARRRVYEFGQNESKTPYYIVSSIGNMWLADASLNEVHHFIAPRADVVRLNDGPRSFSGIDKGRWFVVLTDEAPDQDGWIGYKKLYCNSEARARGIFEDAERIREQYEGKQLEGLSHEERVWRQIEHSEKLAWKPMRSSLASIRCSLKMPQGEGHNLRKLKQRRALSV